MDIKLLVISVIQRKDDRKMTNAFTSLAGKMLDDYKKIPRDAKLSKEASENKKEEIRERMGIQSNIAEKSKEELAVQDMRALLDFIDKKVSGRLTEQDKEIIKKKSEQWRQSISILRNILLDE